MTLILTILQLEASSVYEQKERTEAIVRNGKRKANSQLENVSNEKSSYSKTAKKRFQRQYSSTVIKLVTAEPDPYIPV